jgi:hypothetical protein
MYDTTEVVENLISKKASQLFLGYERGNLKSKKASQLV